MSDKPVPHAAEFDSYAGDYSAGMEHPLKRLIGATFDNFIRNKASHLAWLIGPARMADSNAALLDFGTGAGDLLGQLRNQGFAGQLAGCDESAQMLEQLRGRWTAGDPPDVRVVTDRLPYDDGAFDFVVASSVFHHIPPGERAQWAREIRRVLRPGGRVVVFEHNPLNPVTAYVVRTTPIDRNAILLRADECANLLARADFGGVVIRYILFVPPRFAALDVAERQVGSLPLGGQYMAVGHRRG
jgi:SAM-dependent methyltransferase